MKNLKSIKISDYFQIIKPEYIFLKLIPHNSIRNYNSDRIARAISSLYRQIQQRIYIEEKKLFFETQSKVGYYMYVEKEVVSFYFIVSEKNYQLIKEKIGDTWHNITIEKVAEIPLFSPNAIKYNLTYKKEDALSLATDKRCNTLLSSILSVIDVLEEDDKVGVFYNFTPISQNYWRAEYKSTMQKWENELLVDREKLSTKFIVKSTIKILYDIVDGFMDAIYGILGGETNKAFNKNYIKKEIRPLTNDTKKKKETVVIKTQIVVLSESKSKHRMKNNAFSVCQAFETITSDNELKYKQIKSTVDITKCDVGLSDGLHMSPDEIQNLLSLPAKELLDEYKLIEKVDTFESEIPVSLRTGSMCIGVNTYKGQKQNAYLTSDKEYSNLTLVAIAPARAGKTTLFSNLAKDAVDNGECVIVFDFIGNCELSDSIASAFPHDKVKYIDCDSLDDVQGLGYNEIPIETNPQKMYRNIKSQTSQLSCLINSVIPNDREMAVRMERYLESASIVAFASNGRICDVQKILESHIIRNEFIEKIPEKLLIYIDEYVQNLRELDSTDSKSNLVIGTKQVSVTGILDRFHRLKRNTNMEMMLKKDCSNNINLIEEINKNQLICIRMPEGMFATRDERDILSTYWFTKVWLSLQLRKTYIDKWKNSSGDLTKLNIIVDELYQTPYLQQLITEKLSQMPKFRGRMLISCHYLNQISIIRDELRSANASYMLLQGSDKMNYKELKDEMLPYTLEDLMSLKRYHSLNLIKYEDGYAKFITQLPKPIKPANAGSFFCVKQHSIKTKCG